MQNKNYPHIFTPIQIGRVIFKNRIWSGPAAPHLLYCGEGYPSDEAIAYYARKAAGGAAVITHSAQNMDLEMEYDPVHAYETILNPETQKKYRKLTNAIHAYDAKASLELLAFEYHHVKTNGERVLLSVNGGYSKDAECQTEAFTLADFTRIANSYADVAEAALACGYDMLLIHAGHGLCLSRFYSKIMNRRTDEFGAQTLENRMRFADMILDAIRARVGNKLLIEWRISAEEDPQNHNGYQVKDCIEMIRHLQDRIDIAHVSNGSFYNGTEGIMMPTEFHPHGCNAYGAAAVKACPDIDIPVLTLGAFQDPEPIEEILAEGKADMVAMVRGLIADADRVNKWRCGKGDEAIPCIRCFHCLDYERASDFGCSVNPTVGHEHFSTLLQFAPTTQSKRVVVIGGGPAGMQAAITASQRGHQVTLLEKNGQLGGKLVFAQQVPFKHDLDAFMRWQIHMVEKLGVDVKLNFDADEQAVTELRPDTVIAAVGADAVLPPIPGLDGDNVMTAEQAYDAAKTGALQKKQIAVIGGGLVGCETALFLAKQCGCKVTILEMLKSAANDEMYVIRDELLDHLKEQTTLITSARCSRVDETGVLYLDNSGKEHRVDCELVVVSAGMRPRQALAEQYRFAGTNFVSIGDCVKASNVRNAVRTAYYAAMRI